MRRPTWNEVFAAIGYSLGKFIDWVRSVKLYIGWIFLAGVVFPLGIRIVPDLIRKLPKLPEVSLSAIALLFALGFLFFGAAAFCFVLFTFLSKAIRVEPSISRDLAYALAKLTHPLQTIKEGQPSGGSFTPHDEERAFFEEQIEELKKARILKPTDTFEDLVKSGDFDEEIRSRAKGV